MILQGALRTSSLHESRVAQRTEVLRVSAMSTITAIIEPAEDGTLHLPVPAAWQKLPIRVKAELEPVMLLEKSASAESLKGFGCLRGKISMAADFDEPLADFKDYEA